MERANAMEAVRWRERQYGSASREYEWSTDGQGRLDRTRLTVPDRCTEEFREAHVGRSMTARYEAGDLQLSRYGSSFKLRRQRPSTLMEGPLKEAEGKDWPPYVGFDDAPVPEENRRKYDGERADLFVEAANRGEAVMMVVPSKLGGSFFCTTDGTGRFIKRFEEGHAGSPLGGLRADGSFELGAFDERWLKRRPLVVDGLEGELADAIRARLATGNSRADYERLDDVGRAWCLAPNGTGEVLPKLTREFEPPTEPPSYPRKVALFSRMDEHEGVFDDLVRRGVVTRVIEADSVAEVAPEVAQFMEALTFHFFEVPLGALPTVTVLDDARMEALGADPAEVSRMSDDVIYVRDMPPLAMITLVVRQWYRWASRSWPRRGGWQLAVLVWRKLSAELGGRVPVPALIQAFRRADREFPHPDDFVERKEKFRECLHEYEIADLPPDEVESFWRGANEAMQKDRDPLSHPGKGVGGCQIIRGRAGLTLVRQPMVPLPPAAVREEERPEPEYLDRVRGSCWKCGGDEWVEFDYTVPTPRLCYCRECDEPTLLLSRPDFEGRSPDAGFVQGTETLSVMEWAPDRTVRFPVGPIPVEPPDFPDGPIEIANLDAAYVYEGILEDLEMPSSRQFAARTNTNGMRGLLYTMIERVFRALTGRHIDDVARIVLVDARGARDWASFTERNAWGIATRAGVCVVRETNPIYVLSVAFHELGHVMDDLAGGEASAYYVQDLFFQKLQLECPALRFMDGWPGTPFIDERYEAALQARGRVVAQEPMPPAEPKYPEEPPRETLLLRSCLVLGSDEPGMSGQKTRSGRKANVAVAGEQRFGDWHVQQPLGSWAKGHYYLAKRPGEPEEIVVRTYEDLNFNERRALQAKLKFLFQIDHPGVRRMVIAPDPEDRTPWMGLEHLPHSRTLLDVGIHSHEQLRQVLLHLLRTIDALGFRVHRRIDPRFIRMVPTLGGLRPVLSIEDLTYKEGMAATRLGTGDPLGVQPDGATPVRYLPRDVLKGRPIVRSANMFSVAAMCFELYTGEPLRKGLTPDVSDGRAAWIVLNKPVVNVTRWIADRTGLAMQAVLRDDVYRYGMRRKRKFLGEDYLGATDGCRRSNQPGQLVTRLLDRESSAEEFVKRVTPHFRLSDDERRRMFDDWVNAED